MAASVLSKPGKAFGPCKGQCKHTDCTELRGIASTVCFCGKPIGYGARFYKLGVTYVHADCEEDRVDLAREHGAI